MRQQTVVISFLNPKGGVGKSTLTINLGMFFHLRGIRTLFVDTDPQGSLTSWRLKRDNLGLPGIELETLNDGRDARRIEGKINTNEYTYVIMDGASKVTTPLVDTLMLTNMIIIPVQGSALDVEAASTLFRWVELYANNTNKKLLMAKFLFNNRQKFVETNLSRQVRKEATESTGLSFLNARTNNRLDYEHSASHGYTVFDDFYPGNAAKEIAALGLELEEIINEQLDTTKSTSDEKFRETFRNKIIESL